MNNTILVTGAAGFIGFHLCKRLLALNYRVCGIDNMNSYYSVDLKRARLSELKKYESFIFFEQSVGDSKKLDSVLDEIRPSIIFHLAAQAGVRYSIENPRAYLESNIDETFNLLEALRKLDLKHFLFASTSSAYGASREELLSEDLACQTPMSFYSATKLSCEAMCHAYSNIYDLNITAMRFFTVYGPYGRPDMALMKFIDSIHNDRNIQLYNSGNMKRDFTYVGDVVDALIKLKDIVPVKGAEIFSEDTLSPVANYRLLNVGNGNPKDLSVFLSFIEERLEKKAKVENLPMQPGDVLSTWADTSLLDKLIPDRERTEIQVGINNSVDWYLKDGKRFFK